MNGLDEVTGIKERERVRLGLFRSFDQQLRKLPGQVGITRSIDRSRRRVSMRTITGVLPVSRSSVSAMRWVVSYFGSLASQSGPEPQGSDLAPPMSIEWQIMGGPASAEQASRFSAVAKSVYFQDPILRANCSETE